MSDLFLQRSALLSPCGVYRWELCRTWGHGRRVAWVMLNPSTADANIDDPTIRRCMAFSREWKFQSMTVVNIFALRATDPAALETADDPIGSHNDVSIKSVIGSHDLVIAAWGVHGKLFGRGKAVCDIARRMGRDLKCLGVTKAGHPKHPLRLRGDTVPVAFGMEDRYV